MECSDTEYLSHNLCQEFDVCCHNYYSVVMVACLMPLFKKFSWPVLRVVIITAFVIIYMCIHMRIQFCVG